MSGYKEVKNKNERYFRKYSDPCESNNVFLFLLFNDRVTFYGNTRGRKYVTEYATCFRYVFLVWRENTRIARQNEITVPKHNELWDNKMKSRV
jgi:hypothetical protein